MNENNQVYDLSFKRMIRMSGKMLIKFVNKVFGKKFLIDSEIVFNDPNSEDNAGSVLEKDLYFTVCRERFHLEAQAYWDDMMFRLFNYSVNTYDGYERIDSTHAVFRMPKQAVVFLKEGNRSRDRLYIKLILPDEQEVEYSVYAVQSLGYTPEELVENDMEILLPFQIIRMYSKVKQYKNYSAKAKEKFLNDFSKMCRSIVETMEALKTDGKITNDECQSMLIITQTLKNHIYSSIDDITESGADSMLEEKIIFWDDKVRAEARKEAIEECEAKTAKMLEEKDREIEMMLAEKLAEKDEKYAEKLAEKDEKYAEKLAEKDEKLAEKDRQFAEKMILNDEPAEKIEQYTGLTLTTLKPIAAALGKTLML